MGGNNALRKGRPSFISLSVIDLLLCEASNNLMKAAQISKYGDISAIQLVDIEKPITKDGRVCTKIHASSLNPFDMKARLG